MISMQMPVKSNIAEPEGSQMNAAHLRRAPSNKSLNPTRASGASGITGLGGSFPAIKFVEGLTAL